MSKMFLEAAAVVEDVYFLVTHDPYEEPGAPGSVNGLIVHAATLLHPDLPQPDAGRLYRCLTEFPGRVPGCLVPLSQLDHELDGGLWPRVADRQAVVITLVDLAREGSLFESMPLVLGGADAELLAAPPGQLIHVISPNGVSVLGDHDRRRLLARLEAGLPGASAQPPLFPGDGLLSPPDEPLGRGTCLSKALSPRLSGSPGP